MKVIINSIIPFPGYKAINLFGVIFAKEKLNKVEQNHEAIHTAQMKELLYIFFYVWYLIEWIIRLFMPGNAYRNISFEREAHENDKNMTYLKERSHFSFFRYIKEKKKKGF